jgi:hypothetical protein
MVIEFRSARTRKVGPITHLRKTHTYPIELEETVTRAGPDDEKMMISFIRLIDLYSMYRKMGGRFFERNIRAALPEDEAVNRSIQQSIKRIVIDGTESPAVFAFNHNGVTLFAEALNILDGQAKVVESRLLNGAQTVTTCARFMRRISDEELEEQGITQYKAIELVRLARTYLASDGDLDKFSRFREAFEDHCIYGQVFSQNRLKANFRKVVLCYKVQFRLRRLVSDTAR